MGKISPVRRGRWTPGQEDSPVGEGGGVALGDREGWLAGAHVRQVSGALWTYQQNHGGCGEGCTVARLGPPGPRTSLYR